MKSLFIYIISFIFGFNAPNSNEINGNFVFETDIKKNELYIFNNKLELKTYSLESGVLKSTIKIITENSEEIENNTWSGLYEAFQLNQDVVNGLLDNLILKKFNDKFYLFHDGGVTVYNAKKLIDNGADVLVSGSHVFKANSPIEIIQKLKDI